MRCARQREAVLWTTRPQGCPRLGPHDVELEPVTETERGGLLEEAVHSPAAAASFAEGAECDAADRYRKDPAIAVSLHSEMSQVRQSALDFEEVNVLVSLERKREKGLPWKSKLLRLACQRTRDRWAGSPSRGERALLALQTGRTRNNH